jgi:hypothetical protein
MPLDPTYARLKLLHACDQWHSSRESTALTIVIINHVETVKAVQKEGTVIRSLTVFDGRVFTADAFIDASYEGDLLATAGGSFTVGREAQATYNESRQGTLRCLADKSP